MSDTSVPFNIGLLLPTSQDFKLVRAVKSLDVFEGSSKNFHPDGLFSTETFGRIGDPLRSQRYSYIDLKIPVFHPVIYNTLGKLKRMYHEIIAGKTYAVWDKTIKDFVKSNQLDGETGFHFFESHWRDIQFNTNDSDSRKENIALINKYKTNALCSILVVMPAGMRDYEINDNGQEEEEEINTLYRKMISMSNAINSNSFKLSPEIYNSSRLNIQMTFIDIYELIIGSIKGKKKLYMGKWATRAIHDTTRNVLTTTNVVIEKLGDKYNPGFNNTIVGLYQTIKGLAPITRFRVKNFVSSFITDPKVPVRVVDNKTLESKTITLPVKEYNLWMSDEGLDKILNMFSVEEQRQQTIYLGGEYMALIYKDDKHFKIFYDIKDLPEHLDKGNVTPLKLSELLYYVLFEDVSRFPVLNTRYPITGFGSIYPSFPYLQTTIDSTRLEELDENWQPNGRLAPEFPGQLKWFNSMSVAPSKLNGLGADNQPMIL
jgi:hypothetical protein